MSPNRTPVILISGVAEAPMAAAAISLQWDLPDAAAVRHEIDPDRELLVRTVSDSTGLLERTEVDIEHACATCAIREDIVPTLERLAETGRWSTLIATLPVGAETSQVCRVLGYHPQTAPQVRISAAVVALDATTLTDDLLGEDLLIERGLPVRSDDERGVAETAAAMVEYADLVLTTGPLDVAGRDLITALQRPGARVADTSTPDSRALAAGIHHHDTTEEWVQVVRRMPLTPDPDSSAWTLDFSSDRPFHPERLQQAVEALGRGTHRSRGCFWLPSRPGQVCQWDGAGGMLSIGPCDHWNGTDQLTRIVVVGRGEARSGLAATFESCLLTDAELSARGRYWEVASDGYEPWLGPVHSLPVEAP
ncbi:MAG: CobW family GTP-binding protein [Propioniciclava sp.]